MSDELYKCWGTIPQEQYKITQISATPEKTGVLLLLLLLAARLPPLEPLELGNEFLVLGVVNVVDLHRAAQG